MSIFQEYQTYHKEYQKKYREDIKALNEREDLKDFERQKLKQQLDVQFDYDKINH